MKKAGLGCLVALLLFVLLIGVGLAYLSSGSTVDLGDSFLPPDYSTDDSYGYLGGKYAKIPAAVASELNLVAGAEVLKKGPKLSLATKAGLHAATGSRRVNGHIYPIGGDVITAVNGRKITSYSKLRAVIRSKEPYDTVTITYFRPSWTRPGTSHIVQVELGYDSNYVLP